MNKKILKNFLIVLGICIFFSYSFCSANENSDFFYITWETDGFVPIEYQGKALVSDMGVIKVSIQPFIFSNGYFNSNSLKLRWYLNNEFKREDIGLKDFRFRTNNYGLRSYIVRVEIVFPNNSIMIEEIDIPVVEPKVVISPQNSNSVFRQGILNVFENEVSIKAIPYFFSEIVNSLKYSWFLNGNKQNFERDVDNIIIERFDDEIDVEVLISSDLDSLVRALSELKILFTGYQLETQLEEI